MNPLKIRRLPRPLVATVAIILGFSLIGITTVVLARVIKTDKTLPWINVQHNVRASGTLGVVCDPLDRTDTRAGATFKASVKKNCPFDDVLNEVQFRTDGAGGIMTLYTGENGT